MLINNSKLGRCECLVLNTIMYLMLVCVDQSSVTLSAHNGLCLPAVTIYRYIYKGLII